MIIQSDGSTAAYYKLPHGSAELQDLISHRNMNAQDGEIFRAIYRKGRASHSDELRDAKKVLFYAKAEVERLERLRAEALGGRKCAGEIPEDFGQQNQLIGGAMIRCHDCIAEHCACLAR